MGKKQLKCYRPFSSHSCKIHSFYWSMEGTNLWANREHPGYSNSSNYYSGLSLRKGGILLLKSSSFALWILLSKWQREVVARIGSTRPENKGLYKVSRLLGKKKRKKKVIKLNHLSLYQSNTCYLWEVKQKESLMEIFSPFSHAFALKYQLTSTALMMTTQLSLTTSQITWSRKEFNSVSQVVSINSHRQRSVTEPAEHCPHSWEWSRGGGRERGGERNHCWSQEWPWTTNSQPESQAGLLQGRRSPWTAQQQAQDEGRWDYLCRMFIPLKEKWQHQHQEEKGDFINRLKKKILFADHDN